MAFTDNCDLFASIHEDGRRTASSGTSCSSDHRYSITPPPTSPRTANFGAKIPKFTADVTKFGNPIFTSCPICR